MRKKVKIMMQKLTVAVYLSQWELTNSRQTGKEPVWFQAIPLNVGVSCRAGVDCGITDTGTGIFFLLLILTFLEPILLDGWMFCSAWI